MDPEKLSAWVPVFRDFAIVLVALFMLVYETVFTAPNAIIIGAAGALLSTPAAMWIDARRRAKKYEDEANERWTHLP